MFGWLQKGPGPIALRPRDCHCHVLPGVDDGSRDQAESLAMLRLLHQAGARHVVATPHILPGRFDNEIEPLRRRFEALHLAVDDAQIEIELELGAEHYLGPALLQRVQRDAVLAFGPERYVLFETTTSPHPPVGLLELVYALRDRGFTPLLAHIERYPYLREEAGASLCEDLRAAGTRFQVNRTVGRANHPGRGAKGRFLARMLDRGWVDEVGSDLHRATAQGRPYPHSA